MPSNVFIGRVRAAISSGPGLHDFDAIAGRQLAPLVVAVEAHHGEGEPEAAQGRVVVPDLEAAVPPGVNPGDDVRGLIVGERLRTDEPERLQCEDREKYKGDRGARTQACGDGRGTCLVGGLLHAMHSQYRSAALRSNRRQLGLGAAWAEVAPALDFKTIDALLSFLGVRPFGQDFEIGLIAAQRGRQIAGFFLRLAKFVGGFGIAGLPLQRFLVATDGSVIIFLLEVKVADLDALGMALSGSQGWNSVTSLLAVSVFLASPEGEKCRSPSACWNFRRGQVDRSGAEICGCLSVVARTYRPARASWGRRRHCSEPEQGH